MNKKILPLVTVFSLLGTMLFTSGCGEKKSEEVVPEYVFTYAENQTADYPTTQGAEYFAELVNERTNGRIEIRVYSDAQLGDEVSTVEQLEFGGIDFVRASLSTVTPYSSMCNVLMMPYIYDSADGMWDVLGGSVGERVMNSFDETNLIALSWYDAGVRNFYFKTDIETFDEIAGLKIRVQSNTIMEDMVSCLGATPVPANYEDVYSALETGEVDGAENNWSSYEAMNHNEVAPYFMLDEHMRVPEMQLMSRATMEQLSSEDQDIIRECAAESAEYERGLWTEREEESREAVLSAGCHEITLSDEEKAKFREAMQPLYEKYCSRYMDLLTEIENMEN